MDLADGEQINPGQIKVFSFNVRAPGIQGTYNFQWQMIQEGKGYFDYPTQNASIEVSGIVQPVLSVATSGLQPISRLVFGAQTGVTVGEILFTASGEDIDLTALSVTTTVINPGARGNFRKQVSKLYLYDGTTLVDSRTPTSSQLTFTMTGVRIPVGVTGKRLTIKADFNDIGIGEAGKSGTGLDFRVAQDSYSARGVSFGNLAAGSVSGTAGDNPVAEFTLYKSFPTISYPNPVSSSVPASGTKALFRFSVAASPRGDIGIYRFNFGISTTSATITDFTLFENPGGSETALWNDRVRARLILVQTSYRGYGEVYKLAHTETLFDTGLDGTKNGGEYRIIPAGSIKVFELRGVFKNGHELDPADRPASSVQVELLGDNAFPSSRYPLTADRVPGGSTAGIASPLDNRDGDFVWSDLFYGNNSSSAIQTAEWTNGYRVPGLSQNSSTPQNLN